MEAPKTYCSIDNYLRHNNKAFKDLLDDCCIDPNSATTVLIPSDKNLKQLKALRKSSDRKEFAKLAKLLYAHFIFQNLLDKNFAGGDTGNKLQQTVRLTAPKNGVLEMLSGPDFKTKAKLTIVKNFQPRFGGRDETPIPISVAEIDGEIAIDGVPFHAKSSAPGPKTVGQKTARGKGEFDTQSAKRRNYEYLLNLSKNNGDSHGHCPFVAVMAGLLIWLEGQTFPECEVIKKRVAYLTSYDAVGMYFAIIQPFSENSFLSNDILNRWSFAHREKDDRNQNYQTIWDNFVDRYCGEGRLEKREPFLTLKNEIVNRSLPLDFIVKYEEAVETLYDGVFTPHQKLWADELLFSSYYRCSRGENKHEDIARFGEHVESAHPGNDYEKESIYSSTDYWLKFGGSTLTGESGPVAFLNSKFFLKNDLVDDSDVCKDIIAKCDKKQSNFSIAYRMINPL